MFRKTDCLGAHSHWSPPTQVRGGVIRSYEKGRLSSLVSRTHQEIGTCSLGVYIRITFDGMLNWRLITACPNKVL